MERRVSGKESALRRRRLGARERRKKRRVTVNMEPLSSVLDWTRELLRGYVPPIILLSKKQLQPVSMKMRSMDQMIASKKAARFHENNSLTIYYLITNRSAWDDHGHDSFNKRNLVT